MSTIMGCEVGGNQPVADIQAVSEGTYHGSHVMTKLTRKPDCMQPVIEMAVDLFDNRFDPIETEVRARARQFIEELIRGELDTALARPRYERSKIASNEAGA
jgi:hypothetical protein